jgi:hypothetical protein
MDVSLISAILGAQAGNTRLDMATTLLRMNADSDRAIAQMISEAAQNANSRASVAAGIGTSLDITA